MTINYYMPTKVRIKRSITSLTRKKSILRMTSTS